MAARKRPTPDDEATVRRILLDGLADGTETFKLLGDLEPLHPRNDTFPGEVFLRLAADALDWCGASRADPLDLPAAPTRSTWRPSRSGSCPSAASVDARNRSSSTPYW